MALPDCGFPFWADPMASRTGASRLSRAASIAAASANSKDLYGNVEDDEIEGGRVVESLGQISAENKWFLFVPNGSFPPARAKHAALSIGRRMFVLGGASAEGVLDDVQVFHAERGVWLQLGCGSVPSLYSPSRTISLDARGPRCVGHCLAFWETKLLVIGGRIEPKSQKLKAFALDLQSQSWSVLAPKGEVPVARTGQSIVQVGSALILFGGEDIKGQLLNDIYILDLKALVWLPLKTTGSRPSPRRGHSATCYTERHMLIFGGKAHGNYYNDVHCLDLQTMEWNKEKPKGLVPTGRAGHAGAIVGNKWYIVGGEFRGSEVLDTLTFSLESRSWSVVATVQPGTPIANDGLSVVKVRNKGKVYLLVFGGHGAILSNQVFVMMVSSNKSVPPNRRKEETNLDDFSTSSLPFSFTSGSLRTIQTVLNGERAVSMPKLGKEFFDSEDKGSSTGEDMTEIESPASPASNLKTPAASNCRTPDCVQPSDSVEVLPQSNNLEHKNARYSESYDNAAWDTQPFGDSKEEEEIQVVKLMDGELGDKKANSRSEPRQDASIEEDPAHEARRGSSQHVEGKASSRNFKIERALRNVLRKKEETEKRLEVALSTIDGLERDVQALTESRADDDRRLRAGQAQLEEFESRLNLTRRLLEEAEGRLSAAIPCSERNGTDSRMTELQQQLQDSEQQIVFAVRKQALAERKLLGALKENRELKKRLLLATHGKDLASEAASAKSEQEDLFEVKSTIDS